MGLAAAIIYVTPVLMKLDRASASGGRKSKLLIASDSVAVKECGECHTPFSPVNLPATSWKKIFASLDNHFGEDASLGAAKLKKVSQYYLGNAGRAGKAGLRITKTIWFVRKHGEVGPRLRKRAGTMSNCSSCHNIGGGKRR